MELPSMKRRLFLTMRFWMGSLSIDKAKINGLVGAEVDDKPGTLGNKRSQS